MKKIFKKLLVLVLVVFCGLSLVGCGATPLTRAEAKEYATKVAENVNLLTGYNLSGKARINASYGMEGASMGMNYLLDFDGYVYASSESIDDLKLFLNASFENESNSTYLDQAGKQAKENNKEYMYAQVYLEDKTLFVRKVEGLEQKTQTPEFDEWSVLADEEKLEELPFGAYTYLSALLENGVGDDGYEYISNVLIELATSVLDAKIDGQTVIFYKTQDCSQLVTKLLDKICECYKNQSDLVTTINKIAEVLKAEFNLEYEGDFVDVLFDELDKVLYKTVEDEKVSTTISDVIAMIDNLLDGSGLTVEFLVDNVVSVILPNMTYEALIQEYGQVTLESLYNAYAKPMLKGYLAKFMGYDEITPNIDATLEALLAYDGILNVAKAGISMISITTIIPEDVMSQLMDQEGKCLLKIKKLFSNTELKTNIEGELTALENTVKIDVAYGEMSAKLDMEQKFNISKIEDKSRLTPVEIVA